MAEAAALRGGSGLRRLLDQTREEMVAAERALLTRIQELLQEATPEMPELSLLRDAIKQLDELFLVRATRLENQRTLHEAEYNL